MERDEFKAIAKSATAALCARGGSVGIPVGRAEHTAGTRVEIPAGRAEPFAGTRGEIPAGRLEIPAGVGSASQQPTVEMVQAEVLRATSALRGFRRRQ